MNRVSVLVLLLFPISLFAQHFEAGGMIGVSAYEGDLSPSSIANKIGQTHLSYGVFARYNINEYFAAKFNVYRGKISADDAIEDRGRNLNFESNILEVGLSGEFNILGYQPYNLERKFSPFISIGVAFFKFNPFTSHEGEQVFLQPLGTEGQGLPGNSARYKLGQISIPIGGGVKYAINDKLNIGLELGLRKTFTDHLDDVSGAYVDNDALAAGNGPLAATLANRSGQPVTAGGLRGNPDKLDWYMMGGLTISYNFADNGLVGARKGNSKRTGCPTW